MSEQAKMPEEVIAKLLDAANYYRCAREEDGSPSEVALRDLGYNHGDLFQIAADTLETLRQDAYRYRRIRRHLEIRQVENMKGERHPGLVISIGMTYLDCKTFRTKEHEDELGEKLDDAIDAARSAK